MFRNERRKISTRWSTPWAKVNSRGTDSSLVTAGLWDREKELKAEFERAALPYLSDLYRVAFYLARDETEAEDLVQETYLRAFGSFDKFEPGTNCKAWLLTILRNLFINRYHQKAREPAMLDWEEIDQRYQSTVELEEKNYTGNPEKLFSSKAMVHKLETALKELPEEFRLAIVLVDVQELTYQEAGEVMGCAIGTVRSRIFRGRRILQVALKDYAVQGGALNG